jgi:hypothetical protein
MDPAAAPLGTAIPLGEVTLGISWEPFPDQPPHTMRIPNSEAIAGFGYQSGGARYYVEIAAGGCAGSYSIGKVLTGPCGGRNLEFLPMDDKGRRIIADAIIARVSEDPSLVDDLRRCPQVVDYLDIGHAL